MKAAVKPRTFSNPINGIAYYRHLPANRPHPLVNLDALAVILPYHRG
jgi:hypothetical protein